MQSLLNEMKAIEKSSRLHWIHWVVVTASIVLTLSAWLISKQSIEEKNALLFDRQAKHVVELLVDRMQKYEDGLWGAVAAIEMKRSEVQYPEWLSFAKSLQIDVKYPGINGIGIVYHVTAAEYDAFVQAQRRYRPDFSIHPAHARDDYWPITYIEPAAINRPAVGLDIAHEKHRYAAAQAARDTGRAQITAPITLVQDAEKTPGFLLYVPFYSYNGQEPAASSRKAFSGLVYAPFVVRKLMEGALNQQRRQVGIRIHDGGEVLYDENQPGTPDFDPTPLFDRDYEVDLYGRTWQFEIRSGLSFRELASNNQPMVILVGGILIDTLLLALFILLAQSNRRAHQLASRMIKR